MYRGDEAQSCLVDDLSASLRHLERPSQQRLRGRCAKADDHLRSNGVNFGIEPRTAGRDLDRVRLLVNAALAARLPLEVLHGIGDVHLLSIDAGLYERFVE